MSRSSECIYCGAAQSPHAVLWTDALLNALTSQLPPPERLLTLISPHTFLRILDITTVILTAPLVALGVARFRMEPTADTSARIRSIWDEAKRRGLRMEQMEIVGLGSELCRVRVSTRWTYFTSMPDIVAEKFIPRGNVDQKNFFKRLLEEEDLPYARGGAFFRIKAAVRYFQSATTALIVKPSFGSRARHTTLDIRDEAVFVRALKRSFRISPWCMVEEFIPGDLYRATCVDGKMIGVVHFVKPAITADGTHTAHQLLAIHNSNKKHVSLTDVKADTLFRECLERQGLNEDSVPEKERVVLLAEHSERPNGGYFVDCTDDIPAINRELIERAARATRAPLIGLDIISRDMRLPYTEERLVFIEANRVPFIELHDIPFEGEPRSVAAALWDLWELHRESRKH